VEPETREDTRERRMSCFGEKKNGPRPLNYGGCERWRIASVGGGGGGKACHTGPLRRSLLSAQVPVNPIGEIIGKGGWGLVYLFLEERVIRRQEGAEKSLHHSFCGPPPVDAHEYKRLEHHQRGGRGHSEEGGKLAFFRKGVYRG